MKGWRKMKSLVLDVVSLALDMLSLERTSKYQCLVDDGKTGFVLQREIRTLIRTLTIIKWTCLYFWAAEL